MATIHEQDSPHAEETAAQSRIAHHDMLRYLRGLEPSAQASAVQLLMARDLGHPIVRAAMQKVQADNEGTAPNTFEAVEKTILDYANNSEQADRPTASGDDASDLPPAA